VALSVDAEEWQGGLNGSLQCRWSTFTLISSHSVKSTAVRPLSGGLPDRTLRLVRGLPSPINTKGFYFLRTLFRTIGQNTGVHTRISFGSVEISAPLDHPAIYWRYLPESFNRNFVAVATQVVKTRGGLIIDVGANIGDGVALLRSAGIDAPILAIEGADEWFTLLESNTRHLPSVTLQKALLGSGAREDGLALSVHDGSGKLVKSTSDMTLKTLDEVLSGYPETPIALLKTDTDGFDVRVLLGAEALLKEQMPVLFIEVDEGLLRDQGNSTQELLDYLERCGYSSMAVWDNYGEWLTSGPINLGLSDLIERYPGGLNKPYMDIAAFSATDQRILDAVAAHYR